MTKGAIKKSMNTASELLKSARRQNPVNPDIGNVQTIHNSIVDEFFHYGGKHSVEFMLETLIDMGKNPCILTDKAGRFAVLSAFMQPTPNPVLDGVHSFSFEFKKVDWKKSIRLALHNYLKAIR